MASAATSGLQAMEIAGQRGEFLVLEYRDGDRVYVPVHALHLITRYTGAAPESAPLHKLGTDQWARARRRAAEQMRDVAAELLDLHARRARARGSRSRRRSSSTRPLPTPFRSRRPPIRPRRSARCSPTLQSSRPMDRIVCGDVGFGKTEVAMRAAFVAVQAGRQVARAGADHAARAAASHQLSRSLRRLAGAHRVAVALRHARARPGDARRPSSTARSISSSRRIGCCTRTRASRTSASSSSMRNIASACATRSGCRRCAPKCTC